MDAKDLAYWQQFLELCLSAKTKKELGDLLTFFFTPDEVLQMGRRVALIQALLAGEETQREIAKNLDVSIAKITRGSNMLKVADPILLKGLREKLLKKN